MVKLCTQWCTSITKKNYSCEYLEFFSEMCIVKVDDRCVASHVYKNERGHHFIYLFDFISIKMHNNFLSLTLLQGKCSSFGADDSSKHFCCSGNDPFTQITTIQQSWMTYFPIMQFMTPLLASKLAGQYVAVDPMGLFVSTSQVLPVYL